MINIRDKKRVKDELKRLFKSMDFVSSNFLCEEGLEEKQIQIYYDIYQGLGIAWEFLGLQCKHWDGFKKVRRGKEACKICGKLEDVEEDYYLLGRGQKKRIGRKVVPNSKKTFKNRKIAELLKDSIDFHGASIAVDVHNSYRARLGKMDRDINIAAERTATLKESGIRCSIDQHLIVIELEKAKRKTKKPPYGGFPWAIRKNDLKHFPIIFQYDDEYNFLGLTILR